MASGTSPHPGFCYVLCHPREVVALNPRPQPRSQPKEQLWNPVLDRCSVGRMWQVETQVVVCDGTVSVRGGSARRACRRERRQGRTEPAYCPQGAPTRVTWVGNLQGDNLRHMWPGEPAGDLRGWGHILTSINASERLHSPTSLGWDPLLL